MPRRPGLDHIGLTVPDLEQATAFFERIVCARVLFDSGPFSAPDDWMLINLDVDPRATIHHLRMLGLPGGGMLELFTYSSPDQNNARPRNSDAAGHHAAFRVPDIDTARESLVAAGVKVQGDVKRVDDGPAAGLRWLYFLAPWGMQLEFVQYPDGWPEKCNETCRL